ncbi:hypothetical protein Bca4012_099443 [Brassica carinata]
MFPKWEFDVEDTPAENIIKLMFVKKPWKWTMDCWEVTGTWVNTKLAVVSPGKKMVVKEDSPRPRKKAQDIKTMFKDIADAMREGRLVSPQNRKGHHLKTLPLHLNRRSNPGVKVLMGRTREGIAWRRIKVQMCPQLCPQMLVPRKIKLQNKNDARYQEKRDAALALCRAKSDRTRKLDASQQSPYTANSTARVIISNRKLYPGYNLFAPINKKKLKELADWLKTCLHYRTALDKKPRKSRTWWYQILRTSLEWLEDCHIDAWINVLRKRYDANPQHFRSERMCFLDHLFAQQWRFNFKDFKDSEPDQNGLGRRLLGGAWNYYAGTIPSFCQSNKVWGADIDDIYAPVNFADTHWIAMWISIPKRHIVVFDSICSSISPEELNVRPTNIPPARAGDYGVYTLKYIECHALGIEFSKKDFAKANGKSMRDKMAVDIFQELPDPHEFENKGMDDNLGAYDG